jgi:hypothetical protein
VFKENAEAVNAFGTLRANLDIVKAAERDIFAAQKQGLAGVAVALPNEDASQRAANLRAQFEGELSYVNDRTLSRAENLRQAAIAEWSADLRRNSPGLMTEIDIFSERMGSQLPVFGDPERYLQQTQNGVAPVKNPQLNKEIQEYLKRQAEASERSAAALEDMKARKPITTRPNNDPGA